MSWTAAEREAIDRAVAMYRRNLRGKPTRKPETLVDEVIPHAVDPARWHRAVSAVVAEANTFSEGRGTRLCAVCSAPYKLKRGSGTTTCPDCRRITKKCLACGETMVRGSNESTKYFVFRRESCSKKCQTTLQRERGSLQRGGKKARKMSRGFVI